MSWEPFPRNRSRDGEHRRATVGAHAHDPQQRPNGLHPSAFRPARKRRPRYAGVRWDDINIQRRPSESRSHFTRKQQRAKLALRISARRRILIRRPARHNRVVHTTNRTRAGRRDRRNRHDARAGRSPQQRREDMDEVEVADDVRCHLRLHRRIRLGSCWGG